MLCRQLILADRRIRNWPHCDPVAVPYVTPVRAESVPLARGLAAARAKGAEGVVEALEAFWTSAFPMNVERGRSPMTPLPLRQPGRRRSRKDRSRTIFGRGSFPASSS
jgi:hypothetical protein